ncbi:MAG: BREX system Lon protease-like protein BrxL, partial [Coriobacteriaceae bacterium]|nr:BREX system Lon protease-like protein BrxL [Coriobacteriaceae bacterium]
KGTGKSHIYSEFSPHGMLISGGEVTVAKLFVNNSTGRIGLVGYWDAVAFDEFAGKKKRADRALVDILKNYMANKSFSRGIETLGAEASMVFVGNTAHTVPYMLKNSDLFDELPEQYHDPAFLDRIHFYIPGWEFEQIRNEMFSNGYGFVVDYLAEVLRHMRDADYSDKYQQYFELSSDITTRDRDGVHKTFSGLMKLIHPTGEASKKEIETLLQTAIEGRRRVKDQLIRIDSTMVPVKFEYRSLGGEWTSVTTLEADEFPELYGVSDTGSSLESGVESSSESNGESNTDSTSDGQSSAILSAGSVSAEKFAVTGTAAAKPFAAVFSADEEKKKLKTGHYKIPEGRKGVSYDILFGPYIAGANRIELVDPYIRVAYQARNLMEFIETVAKAKDASQEVTVVLITKISDEGSDMVSKQAELLEDVQNGATLIGINLEIEYSETIHDRSIKTDTGWLISLGRGLDIFQQFDTSWFDPRLRQQRYRQVKEFEITYMRQAVKE